MKKRNILAGVFGLVAAADLGYAVKYHLANYRPAVQKEIEMLSTPEIQHYNAVRTRMLDLQQQSQGLFEWVHIDELVSLRDECLRISRDPRYIRQLHAYSKAKDETAKTDVTLVGILIPGLIAGYVVYRLIDKKQKYEQGL
ncbi:MAG TPA: hypothetical protein VJC07_03485 [Candidatus Nanoarchaeia archaeon]|nr:hypothetical protein [Candidatus Nanoarchaeia archaeon]